MNLKRALWGQKMIYDLDLDLRSFFKKGWSWSDLLSLLRRWSWSDLLSFFKWSFQCRVGIYISTKKMMSRLGSNEGWPYRTSGSGYIQKKRTNITSSKQKKVSNYFRMRVSNYFLLTQKCMFCITISDW
jgi:hypothetical protein